MELPPDENETKESALKDAWESEGNRQASALLELGQPDLPVDLSVAGAISLFLRTLKGQSVQTHKTYRVGCRVFMLFLYATNRGNPAEIAVVNLPSLILEDYYLWLVDKYSRAKKMTLAGYMSGPRNLF